MSCTFKLALALLILGFAQDEKKGPVDPKPRIAMALPLAVVSDARTPVTVRGLNLGEATEVRFAEPVAGASIVVKSKGKAEMPKDSDPALLGDTKVELEITLPAGFAGDKVALIAVNKAGETAPYELAVLTKEQRVLEKEPNGGFAAAQPVEAGQTVQGAVSQALDVDVFKISGRKGETWRIEVEAQRRGSVLDAILSVHDAGARLLATSDDASGSRDPSLRLTLPADGAYFISLLDAHNSGGATHAYLLRLSRN